MQNSDEEEENEYPPLLELVKTNLRRIVHLLEVSIPKEELPNSYDASKYIPLGSIRLKVVELVHLVMKLHKKQMYESVIDSDALSKISSLLT